MLFAPEHSLVREIFHDHVPSPWARYGTLFQDWNAERFRREGRHVTHIALSKDGDILAMSLATGGIEVWDT